MKKKTASAAAVLLACITLLSACAGNADTAVSVQSVSMITGFGSTVAFDRYAGIVEAGDTIDIEKDEGLEVDEILVSVGDPVSAGQVLFTYDTEAISLELEKKQLELEQLKNAIDTKKSQISALERERSNASSSAQLDYTLQIQELELDVAESAFTVTAKEKEIERTKTVLENGRQLCPVDGTIHEINKNGGYDNYGNPLPFISVTQTGDYRVKGTINEQNRGALMEGSTVIIRSRVDENATWSGYLSFIDWDNPESGNNNYYYASDDMSSSSKYPFYITLDDSEGLMLGQHVYIEPDNGQYEEAEVLALPSYYIVDADSDPFVWAENSRGKLEKRHLTLGEYNMDFDTYPVLDGLTADDYIAFPDDTCAEGAPVTRYDEQSFDDGYEDGMAYDAAMPVPAPAVAEEVFIGGAA